MNRSYIYGIKNYKCVEENKIMTTETKEAEAKTSLPAKLEKILTTIEELTVLELAQLVKALEEKFGVSAAAAVAVAAPATGGAAAVAEEKTAFQVTLTSAGDKKIQVIKEIRALTNLGLKEAKDLVEGAPKVIKDGATKEEAQKIKAAVEANGGKVEIK